MTDLRALEAAATRLETDPTRTNRIAGEAKQVAARARAVHPDQAWQRALDVELAAGIRAASQLAGAEQLLAVEQLLQRVKEREAEASAAAEKERQAHCAQSIAQRAAMMAGGHVGRPLRDPTVIGAARELRDRLEVFTGDACAALDEEAFQGVLASIEGAGKRFAGAIGVSRRASRLRASADAARTAVAAITAAAAA